MYVVTVKSLLKSQFRKNASYVTLPKRIYMRCCLIYLTQEAMYVPLWQIHAHLKSLYKSIVTTPFFHKHLFCCDLNLRNNTKIWITLKHFISLYYTFLSHIFYASFALNLTYTLLALARQSSRVFALWANSHAITTQSSVRLRATFNLQFSRELLSAQLHTCGIPRSKCPNSGYNYIKFFPPFKRAFFDDRYRWMKM